MKLKQIVAALSVFAVGQAAVFAEGFGHEFSIDVQSIKLDGTSADSQAIDYTYYPRRADSGEYPYAEAAFITQAPFVAAAIDSAGADTGSGSREQWSYALNGRWAFSETPYFLEAGYSRLARSIHPLVLSTASNYNAIVKTLNVSGGMYVAPAMAVDFSLARSEADISSGSDVTALTLNLHGKALLPVADHMYAAIELSVARTSSETGAASADATSYAANGAWYYDRAINASLGFGRGIDEVDSTTEYRTFNIGAGWFIEPELQVSLDILQRTWDDNSKDRYITLHFAQRL